MSLARLGVNIDHVATLRQQRGEYYPEVGRAAEVALVSGAHQITIHLREDRRHIQDHDLPTVQEVCKKYGRPLNLEMGCHEEMIQIALETKPDWVCLVPEKREERTTEGGLSMLDDSIFKKVKATCASIKAGSPQTKISLFVEADEKVLERCLECHGDAVEIHTGEYARDFLQKKDFLPELERYRIGQKMIKAQGWGYHAGHGLTLESLGPLLQEGLFEEYNIGHWIVSEAVFLGLGEVIQKMLALINKYPLKVKA